MSSDYGLICLSHDPAIGDDDGFSSREQALVAITANRTSHPRCDIVIGRYSCSLIEVICPDQGTTAGKHGLHTDDKLLDVGWLRLLHLARENGSPTDEVLGSAASCWPADRLARLAPLLGIEEMLSRGGRL